MHYPSTAKGATYRLRRGSFVLIRVTKGQANRIEIGSNLLLERKLVFVTVSHFS